MSDTNDAAPAEVQNSDTDQKLATAVVKAVDAYNQFAADLKATEAKLAADVSAALVAARKAGITVRYDSWPFEPDAPRGYADLTFSRTTPIVVPK